MGLNRLTGTPWHIENYHRAEDDNRRHKSKCKYYNKSKCEKFGYPCYGSAHCEEYIEINKKEKSKIKYDDPKEGLIINEKKITVKQNIPYGEFTVIFLDDNETITRTIGAKTDKNYISAEIPLAKAVLNSEVGAVFEINNEPVKLISKDIKYKSSDKKL